MFQKRNGAFSRSDRSKLWPPYAPVSENVGKSAAFAAPICAFVDTTSCSSRATSGRRSSKVDGRPGGGVTGTGSASIVPGAILSARFDVRLPS